MDKAKRINKVLKVLKANIKIIKNNKLVIGIKTLLDIISITL